MLFHKSKGIIIVGCSPFGAALANTLYNKGHKVVVLDKDRESFRYLPDGFGGAEMEGDPTDPKVLKEAGIETRLFENVEPDPCLLYTSRCV